MKAKVNRMELTGLIKSINQDYDTGQFQVTISIEGGSSIANQLVDLIRQKVSVRISKYRQKRSLDANAYCWVLCSKIAEACNTSKDEVYEEMLQKYGYFYKDDNGYITVTVKAEVDMSKIQGHWKFYSGNENFSAYLMIKGSSQYDSAEMAKFIDRIVDEAKGLDIETLPPAQLQSMIERWGKEGQSNGK